LDLLETVGPGARLFTYKVAHDGGSAPNPYHSVCTLAVCKPAIRRVAKLGDVIVGLACAPDDRRLVYCMVVDHVLPWADYIRVCKGTGEMPDGIDARKLKNKLPRSGSDPGDCIWPDAGRFDQAMESSSGHGGKEDWDRDVVNGQNVVLSKRFWYFGKGDQHALRLDEELLDLIPGRGHRSDANRGMRAAFVDFFNRQLVAHKISSYGKHGVAALASDADDSERSSCRAREREFDTAGEETAREGNRGSC
jgi:hypothetical protein